MFLEQV